MMERGTDSIHRHWPGAGQMGGVDGLCPDWPAPNWIHALTTLRGGGVSAAPYKGLNLAEHVGDDPISVCANRDLLGQVLKLPAQPCWLNQVHGTVVVDAAQVPQRGDASAQAPVEADASFAMQRGIVCAVLTADCLPLLFCDRRGSRVAAVHAGWRGLAAGVIEKTVGALAVPAKELLVWLGPAIGPLAFEVGAEVRATFMAFDAAAEQAFQPSLNGLGQPQAQPRYRADLYRLARLRLQGLGIEAIYGGHWCCYDQPEAFYSFRRQAVTGRMASLIWMSRE